MFVPCKIIQIRRDKKKKKKKTALQTDLSTSLLPANNITGINQQVIVWMLTDFSAWSDLVAHKWVRHTWSNHCKSIQSQPQGYWRTMGQWNEILCRKKQQNSHRFASWHSMTSASEQKAFRHGWHGAYRCQTLPLVPQGWFACFTGCNSSCVLGI